MAQAPGTQDVDADRLNRRISIMIVVGATLVGVVLLFGFSLVHLFRGQVLPVDTTGAERQVVVSAEFLEARLEGYLLRRDAESFRKTRFVNQRIDLDYDYEQDGIELRTRIDFEGDADKAAVRYQQQRDLLEKMMESHSPAAKRVVMNATLSWGDESSFAVVNESATLAGVYFVGYQEDTVFTFWMQGIDFREMDVIVFQIRQSLSALEDYRP